jgi:hypothetical protein
VVFIQKNIILSYPEIHPREPIRHRFQLAQVVFNLHKNGVESRCLCFRLAAFHARPGMGMGPQAERSAGC